MSCPDAAAKDASASPSESDPGQRYPRALRLTTRSQFLAVYERGRRVSCAYFTLHGLPNEAGHPRLGVTVTRKIGSAAVRNRIKRRLREVFRRNLEGLASDLDVVVNVRPALSQASWEHLEAQFVRSFRDLARRSAS